jgi:hypothetical protein
MADISMEWFSMRASRFETFDAAGVFAGNAVRFRTEKSIGFPQLTSIFLKGRRRDSRGAA